MLTLKNMSWSNCFSYGDNNYIEFDKDPLTQLNGINGSGKTSISLMIQEVLYGKNSKNIKKQDIANNRSGKPGYYINLKFDKDGDEYSVTLNRKSSLKLEFTKNDEDISSHTSLDTYKTIANIIGIADFKVFCQLIYQHSTNSLEFLTATDTTRKKFLISLLQLDKYLELHELFKEQGREVNSEILNDKGKIETIKSWILRHENMDFVKKDFISTPIIPNSYYSDIVKLRENIENINSINRTIATNNEYIKQLQSLNPLYYLNPAPPPPKLNSNELRTQVRIIENEYNKHQGNINKLTKLVGQCHSCMQDIDENIRDTMIDVEIEGREKAKEKMGKLWDEIQKAEAIESEINIYKKAKTEFERLNQLIDSSLPQKTLDINEEKQKLMNLESKISKLEAEIRTAEKQNRDIASHNSKVDVVQNQLKEMQNDLKSKQTELLDKEKLNRIIELLKKTFSTNGLVSYKIESSVKELEKTINKYLAELIHFQIYFKLSGEKLNIEVVDDIGNATSMSNLSSGEQARVNLATLLGIRNILSSLSNTKINLLFLDEITGSLDAEGKEKFTEILLEENLNTFFVSHEWQHPLVPTINIVKEHGISRIE